MSPMENKCPSEGQENLFFLCFTGFESPSEMEQER